MFSQFQHKFDKFLNIAMGPTLFEEKCAYKLKPVVALVLLNRVNHWRIPSSDK